METLHYKYSECFLHTIKHYITNTKNVSYTLSKVGAETTELPAHHVTYDKHWTK